jgi:hypothetical protein
MPKKKSFDTVRTMGLALPDVEAGTAYGVSALKVRGKMFTCRATHKSAEPNSVVMCVGFDRRDELIAEEPSIYYLKQHYVNYPVVLVRLTRISDAALRDLLRMARRFVLTSSTRRAGRRTRKARA